MNINFDPINQKNSDGSPLTDYQYISAMHKYYVVDGSVNLFDVMEVERTGETIFPENIKVIEISEPSVKYLADFGFGEIRKYIATKERYDSRISVLNKLSLQEYEEVLLVLLVKGFWGLPKSTIHYDNLAVINKEYSTWEYYNRESLNEIFNNLNLEEAVREGDYYQRTTEDINRLKKITFHFGHSNTGSDNKVELEIKNEKNTDQVIISLLNWIKSFVDTKTDILQMDVSTPLTNEYYIFCFKVIEFLDNLKIVEYGKRLSKRRLYQIYFDLLKDAGYHYNFDSNISGRLEGYFKKWYGYGKQAIAEKKNVGTFFP